ncbi:YdeI/OmpD-associated family protein [Pelagibacterium sp. 26DY04]|uniref:YdeI/OmpD-associated family protein n=1 Tax=Pelagibacterium sp. 26DY04 TaxID=2967130 RepID=UPI002815A4A3|nr:YdeI/OmpD-associated family protein [Pelagibacterium sp. 26DY04]WMT87132.1 YdeI/OmpD-associated family protein [Pelagibacterium sp. 26DY04]
MPPVIPDPEKIRPFVDFKAFYDWLAQHGAEWDEVWVQFYKKASGLPTLSYEDAVRAGLCWGWIDGIKKKHDEVSFVLRFTPRRKKSIWSRINTRHAENLIEEGLMREPGLIQIQAAKADGRWEAAYASGAEFTMPEDFVRAVEADPAALETYKTLNRANLFALAFRINNAKKAETRVRNIEKFVAMLARGETLHPNGKGK